MKLLNWLKFKGKIAGKSYHDVDVFVDGTKYHLFDCSYGLELTCTRCGGWKLWHHNYNSDRTQTLIGGEYDSEQFRIEIDGVIICTNELRS